MEEKHCKWYNDEFCTNGDSPCVADYCPVVEYPELCKHREVDYDINVRSKTEDKNLTDEEIAKAILQQIEYNAGIPYINEWQQVKTIKFTEILDFIQHLQGENAVLKERGEIVINSLHETIDAQKAEIERLKDENIEQRDIHFKNLCEYKDEIARLEKQVDELKEENKELYKENTMLISGSILERKDIAKDTAKEILDELDLFFKGTTFRKGYEFKKIDEKLKELKKRNGVEVE